MIDFLKYLVSFLLVLAPLVVIHEFGHFIVAKLFGVGVPIFSVGMGPRIFGIEKGGTDYRLSLIPLGGYVRLAGDEADENRTGAPHEFLSRPKYQRFLVYVAGAVFNIALAVLAMWFYFGQYGVQDPVKYPVVIQIEPAGPAEVAGLLPGDKLISVEGRDLLSDADGFLHEVRLSPGTNRTVEVERDGNRMMIPVSIAADVDGTGTLGIRIGGENTPMIQTVIEGRPAAQAGLMAGDLVIRAGTEEPVGYERFMDMLKEYPGRPLALIVKRESGTIELVVTPSEVDGTIGVKVSDVPLESVHRDLALVPALKESVAFNLKQSKLLFTILGKLLKGELSMKTMSGPIGIAQVSKQAIDSGWEAVISLLAFISLQLGILNLLPIPVLDGGHILILGVEGVMRRDLPERLKDRVTMLGFVFLLALMSYVIYGDVLKL